MSIFNDILQLFEINFKKIIQIEMRNLVLNTISINNNQYIDNVEVQNVVKFCILINKNRYFDNVEIRKLELNIMSINKTRNVNFLVP
jgi:hypothetical protein